MQPPMNEADAGVHDQLLAVFAHLCMWGLSSPGWICSRSGVYSSRSTHLDLSAADGAACVMVFACLPAACTCDEVCAPLT